MATIVDSNACTISGISGTDIGNNIWVSTGTTSNPNLASTTPLVTTGSIKVTVNPDGTQTLKYEDNEYKKIAKEISKNSEVYKRYSECFEYAKKKINSVNKNQFAYLVGAVKIYVPDKVMGVWIKGKEYKQVVKEPDVFSMEFGIALAISKFLFREDFTAEGVEKMAHELLLLKDVNTEIRRAIRVNKEAEKHAKRIEETRKEALEIRKRRREKNKKRRERRRKDFVNAISEAVNGKA